ncbi:hypothetical protein E1B28_007290 [Marasmius oreades]|uniref:Uncharacterized protein n=1 Tax=Marasmius oreades TaxID=181124 RepID=A0A9P7S1C7_9AGAR|nr:uncharacterized protein E1B28_007290 [Marasmius oreades]KAG7093626.1 hypothetical protein E1B28_007290 [Marasmius oreades]
MYDRSQSRLPQELVDNIIDYNSSSVRDLKSLSLIGRPWLARSRKHLFRVLRLDATYNPNILSESLISLHAVLSFVRRLKLESTIPNKPFQLPHLALVAIQQSFPSLLHLTLKGVVFADDPQLSPSSNVSLRNLALIGVSFKDAVAMLRFLCNSLFSLLTSLSIDEVTFSSIDPRPPPPPPTLPSPAPSIHQPPQLQEFVLGNVRSSVLRALWAPPSPFDFYSTLTRVSLCNRVSLDCADVALANTRLWSSVTHLACSAWRLNVTSFPPNITHLTMTYKTLSRQGSESRLSHLATTSPKLQHLLLVFYWPHRTDSEKLNNIMSDFDDDLATVATSLPVQIYIRFVLKSEHSADFALMERLQAMFLRTDDAMCLKGDEFSLPLNIEVKEISDTEYRADLRLGLGFEY